MADRRTICEYKYTVQLQYLNVAQKVATVINNESLKFLLIDHNYDVNCMPVVYASLSLDRALVDNMIKNQNDNMFIIELNKYDDNTDMKIETLCFREKFTYFLPDSLNKMDMVDYNEETNEEMKGNTLTPITIGLLCIKHANNNKKLCEITVRDTKMSDIVQHFISHFNNMVMETFTYNEKFDQFVLPPQESVNKALRYLNGYRVFYSTPYRFYQDFNFTYLISSSGKALRRGDNTYTSVILNIKDIDENDANTGGIIINKTSGTYEVFINYANTQAYDNTLVNKSKNKIRGIGSSGTIEYTLENNASYSTEKVQNIRIDNGNEHMMENIVAENNSDNFLLFFTKNDLDNDVFTLNKRITIHNIDRYQEYNGTYLVYRKREMYLRQDSSFILSTMIHLKRIGETV